MIKKSKFIRGFTIRVVLVIGCFLLGSCVDSNIPLTENEEQIPLKLSVSLTDNGYTSDSEIIPMNTRGYDKPYVVTQIANHTLFILKKVDLGWCVTAIKHDIIQNPSGGKLWAGEKLELTEAGKNMILVPGTYQFLLLVNTFINPSISIGDVIAENSVIYATSDPIPLTDFYIAKTQLEVKKSNSLNQDNKNEVTLKLHRNSALVRFILEDTEWNAIGPPSVSFKLTGDACVGIDIFGNPIQGVLTGKEVEMGFGSTFYSVSGKQCRFSSINQAKFNLSLFVVNENQKPVRLVISRIGGSNFFDFSFKGAHDVGMIPVSRNHIITILIRKENIDNSSISLKTEINPTITEWSSDYPPLDYIELNNY